MPKDQGVVTFFEKKGKKSGEIVWRNGKGVLSLHPLSGSKGMERGAEGGDLLRR